MRLNQKVRYGVACLFELSKTPNEYIHADSIADKQRVPHAYAQKILQALAQAGIIFAQKGAGYRLSRPLSSITALEVIEALTVDNTADDQPSDVAIKLERRVNQVLGSFTIAELG